MQMARAIAPEIKKQRGALGCLRKRPERLNDKQKIRRDEVFEAHPAIKVIYQKMNDIIKTMNLKSQNKQQCKTHSETLLQHIQSLKSSDVLYPDSKL